MPPWQGGGNMIQDVTFERTRFHQAPAALRGGHRQHRRRGRPRRGARLRRADRPREHRDATSTSCSSTRPSELLTGPGPDDHRHRAARRPASSRSSSTGSRRRRRRAASTRRHRGALRPSLRAADPAAVRLGDDRPRVARVLQHVRGDRRAGRGAPRHPGRDWLGRDDPSVDQVSSTLTTSCGSRPSACWQGCNHAAFRDHNLKYSETRFRPTPGASPHFNDKEGDRLASLFIDSSKRACRHYRRRRERGFTRVSPASR